MTDFTKKPCICGGEMGEVIGFKLLYEASNNSPIRKGWYCVECQAWEDAILREMIVVGCSRREEKSITRRSSVRAGQYGMRCGPRLRFEPRGFYCYDGNGVHDRVN